MIPKLAITMGDAAGIGPEITVKAFVNGNFRDKCIPVVIGDYEAMIDAVRLTKSNIHVEVIEDINKAKTDARVIPMINLDLLPRGSWEYKKVCAKTGHASFEYVRTAIEMTLEGNFDAVVTGPINKESINIAGHHYSGHTEIFADMCGQKKFGMLLVGGGLRVIHVSTHVSMEDACRLVTKQRVLDVVGLAWESARLLGIESPKIGVAGFNAHCSENGLFGTQEKEEIIPAVSMARDKGWDVDGPVPPDTVFVKALSGMYDVVVAMYHDQGHIPVKLLGFRMEPGQAAFSQLSGINCTIGLPFIRTSVDHGTAFGKAGDNRANETSMIEAIEAAITMSSYKKGTV